MLEQSRFHVVTRRLHGLIAFLIPTQLLVGVLMNPPHPGAPVDPLFLLHKVLGLLTAAVLLAFLAWACLRRTDTPLNQLFPWFGTARKQAWAECKGLLHNLKHGHLPEPQATVRFVSAVHGAGLLLALGMGATGTVLWLLAVAHASSGFVPLVADVHSALASLMWAYLVGHGLMALIHHGLGHGTLKRMFG